MITSCAASMMSGWFAFVWLDLASASGRGSCVRSSFDSSWCHITMPVVSIPFKHIADTRTGSTSQGCRSVQIVICIISTQVSVGHVSIFIALWLKILIFYCIVTIGGIHNNYYNHISNYKRHILPADYIQLSTYCWISWLFFFSHPQQNNNISLTTNLIQSQRMLKLFEWQRESLLYRYIRSDILSFLVKRFCPLSWTHFRGNRTKSWLKLVNITWPGIELK